MQSEEGRAKQLQVNKGSTSTNAPPLPPPSSPPAGHCLETEGRCRAKYSWTMNASKMLRQEQTVKPQVKIASVLLAAPSGWLCTCNGAITRHWLIGGMLWYQLVSHARMVTSIVFLLSWQVAMIAAAFLVFMASHL